MARLQLSSLVCACLLTLAACESGGLEAGEEGESESESGAQGETGADSSSADAGLTLSGVSWSLGWESPSSAAELWQTTNALGYEIRVEGAWLGAWGASLIECDVQADADWPSQDSAARRESGALELASPWLIVEGHPGDSDPSGALFDRVEVMGEGSEAETIELEPTAYCNAHFIYAGISPASAGFAEAEARVVELAPEQTLAGASLLIIGHYLAPGSETEQPFVLRSEHAYGRIVALELEGIDAAELGHAPALEVELRREVAGLFEDIDFEDPEGELGWTALGNLARASRMIAR